MEDKKNNLINKLKIKNKNKIKYKEMKINKNNNKWILKMIYKLMKKN